MVQGVGWIKKGYLEVAFLEVSDLVKDFGGVVANNHVSFQIDQGEIIGLIGPNGAGKTTLFNCIVGYHKPDSGKVTFMIWNVLPIPSRLVIKGLNPVISFPLKITFPELGLW